MLLLKNHSQLEKIAEDFLDKHGKFDGRMVMIELVVQNLGYYVWPLRGLGQIAEAFVPRKPGIIFVDEDQMLDHPIRFRFTLAEELAHTLIHADALRRMSPDELERFNDLMTAGQYRRYERDAKYLASCLLMRRSAFVERFYSHRAVQTKRVSNPGKVLRYAIRQLGIDFCVPVAAASQRAFKLHLITEAQFTELGYFPA
jgi:Zn-dependent peptidase ImmA (M78 family)